MRRGLGIILGLMLALSETGLAKDHTTVLTDRVLTRPERFSGIVFPAGTHVLVTHSQFSKAVFSRATLPANGAVLGGVSFAGNGQIDFSYAQLAFWKAGSNLDDPAIYGDIGVDAAEEKKLPRGLYLSGPLAAAQTIGGISVEHDVRLFGVGQMIEQVAHSGGFKVLYGTLAKDQQIGKIQLTRGTTFATNALGNVHHFSSTAPSRQIFSFHEGGELVEEEIAVYMGVFNRRQEMVAFRPAEKVVIRNIHIHRELNGHFTAAKSPDGSLHLMAEPGTIAIVSGIPVGSPAGEVFGKWVDFHPNGQLQSATLGSTKIMNRLALPEGTGIRLNAAGALLQANVTWGFSFEGEVAGLQRFTYAPVLIFDPASGVPLSLTGYEEIKDPVMQQRQRDEGRVISFL